jgi:hypothetical protein
MRGVFTSKALNSIGYKTSCILDKDLDVEKIESEKIFVFVKYDNLGLTEKVKQKGSTVVFDIVDSKKSWLEYKSNIDFVIAGSDVHIQHIRSNFSGECLRIPHVITNTCDNFKLQFRKSLESEIKTIGYIGTPKTFTDPNDFHNYCVSNDMKWLMGMPTVTANNNIQMTTCVDLGCIYYTHEKQRFGGTVTSTKPATKLMNFFSFGIPALFTHYDSYVEEIVRYGYHDLLWCLCNSKHSMFDKIKILRRDNSFYKSLGDQSFELSRNFHVSKIEEIYKPLLQL